VKADNRPGKASMAEMGDRCRCSEGAKAAGDKAAMPPAGSDGGEGQNGRTDKEGKGGRGKDDERGCRCNDDRGRREHDDRRRHGCAEQRAG
jgi:hypothetical protein